MIRFLLFIERRVLQSPPLPPRVQARVRQEEWNAEILIGVVQVLAILTFCVLYGIARLSNPPLRMMVQPIPVVLALYALFTAIRLTLAIVRKLNSALLALSVVVDIAVLMALIWTFQFGSSAPPSIYLKSSTLMYVFILIALRALRQDAFYVILAGGTAVVFWAALLAYAYVVSGPRLMLTHNFTEYATSPAELLGAEFDKFVSIAMVSAVLAFTVIRGRRLLVETARGELALNDFSRFVDPAVADRLRSAHSEVMAGMAERRQVAILTTDLRGFTALSRKLEATALLNLIAAYQAIIVPAIQRHGGSIDKYLGDGILASFGAVTPSDTYAADALRALEDVRVAVRDWTGREQASGLPPVRVGAAVATGEALFGIIGSSGRLEYTVIGDPVNLAAKLEKHTKAEDAGAVVTAEGFRLARAQGYQTTANLECRPGRMVAGVEGALDLMIYPA